MNWLQHPVQPEVTGEPKEFSSYEQGNLSRRSVQSE